MSTFYDEAITLALAAITEAGQTAVLARIAKTHNPMAGSVSAHVATKGNVAAVLLPLNKNDESKLDNSLLEALRKGKLRKLLVAASGAPFEPEGSDIFVFGSSYWVTRGCTPLAPAGTPIVYTVIVERGNLTAADIAALAA